MNYSPQDSHLPPLSNIEYLLGDHPTACHRLTADDDSFDVVYSARVFQHLNHPEKGAQEIVRVLKPGGRFAVFVQNRLCPLNLAYYSRLYTPGQVRSWFDGTRL